MLLGGQLTAPASEAAQWHRHYYTAPLRTHLRHLPLSTPSRAHLDHHLSAKASASCYTQRANTQSNRNTTSMYTCTHPRAMPSTGNAGMSTGATSRHRTELRDLHVRPAVGSNRASITSCATPLQHSHTRTHARTHTHTHTHTRSTHTNTRTHARTHTRTHTHTHRHTPNNATGPRWSKTPWVLC